MVNESLDIAVIGTINRQISSILESCQSLYDTLMSNYSNEKTVIRSYARFLEKYKFDTEKSQELYQEANVIEEEEAVNRRMQISKSLNKKAKHNNKIVPLVSVNNMFATSLGNLVQTGHTMSTTNLAGDEEPASESSYFDRIDQQKPTFSGKQVRMDQEDFDQDRFDGVEENGVTAQQKKEFLFKTALRSSMYNKPQFFTFAFFSVASLAILIAGMVIGLVFSSSVTADIFLSKDICVPSSVPLSMLRYVREKQLHDQLKNTSVNWNTGYKSRFSYQCEKLENLHKISITNLFSDLVRADFTKSSRVVTQPVLIYSSSNTSEYNGYSTTRNTTIAEITKTVLTSCNSFIDYPDDAYAHSVDDYNFMFMYLNRANFSLSYENFCSEYLSRNKEKSSTFKTIFLGYYIATTAVYILAAVSVIAFTRYHLSGLNDSIKLIGKTISKDKVGKIYHKLEATMDEDLQIGADGIFASLFKPANSISILVLAMITITAVCVTLFFVETVVNSEGSSDSIQNIQYSVSVMMSAQRVGFRLGEIFIFRAKSLDKTYLNDPNLITPEELDQFHTDNKYLAELLQTSWNSLIFGNSATNSRKLIGKYADIDNLILGTCQTNQTDSLNCTGIDDIITKLTSTSAKFNEDIFYNSYQYNSTQIYDWAESIFDNIDTLSYKVEEIIQLYSKYNATPTIAVTVTLAIFGFLSLLFVIYYTKYSMESFWKEYRQLRMMLNYFGCDVLSENEELKNYILFKTLPGRLSLFRKQNDSATTSSEDQVRSILNAAVDGAILCNSQAEITIFNPSAERYFGYKKSDVMGLSIYKIFDENDSPKVQKSVKAMLQDTNEHGESLEVECVRKNQTKFPAKINIFSSQTGAEVVIVCFIKGMYLIYKVSQHQFQDVTPEKKQNMLLEEEKKKSDSLLLNILPETVGKRLKAGKYMLLKWGSKLV